MIAWSAHLSMLFGDLPELERPAAAHALGFSAVESWWLDDETSADAWSAELQRLELDVALLNCNCGDIRSGARGYLNLPGVEERALRDFDAAIELAARVGAPHLNVLSGIEAPGSSRGEQLGQVAELLGECARRAAARGLTVLIEPLNEHDVPGYLVCDVPSALELAERSGAASVGLLYDVYHAASGGRDPAREIEHYADRIGHVQFADHPGRGAPGTGTLDLEGLVDVLLSSGYVGSVGLECEPASCDLAALAAALPRRAEVVPVEDLTVPGRAIEAPAR